MTLTNVFVAGLMAISSFAYAGSGDTKTKAKGTVRATTAVATPSASCNPGACKPASGTCSPAACKSSSAKAAANTAPWLVSSTACAPAGCK